MQRLSRKCTVAVLITLVSIGGLSGCGALTEALAEAEKAKELEITPPELDTVADGTYRGFYEAGLTKAEVETRIRGGRIVTLQLLSHDHGRGGEAEILVDRIVERQTLDLDTVSGATISSKVILKASELAIKKGTE